MNGNDPISEKESIKIWKMKAIAILLVICAHCSSVEATASGVTQMLSNYVSILGSLGVVVFFFSFGYLFSYKDLKTLATRRIRSLLIPWIFCGTLVYLYVSLRKGGFSVFSWLEWLAGNQTYLWYMTVTLILTLVGELIFLIGRNKAWLRRGIFLFLGTVSLCITVACNHNLFSMHPYWNIFRWLWIFSAGVLLREMGFLDRVPSSAISPVLLFTVALLPALFGVNVNYWTDTWIPAAIVAILLVCLVSFKSRMDGFLVDVGKKSFSVYLLHMPLAGIVTNLCNRLPDSGGVTVIVRPFIVLLATYGTILFICFVTKKTRIERVAQVLLGIR